MKSHLLPLLFAAALPVAALFSAPPTFASPADAVGKPMPALDVDFLGEKPAYENAPRIIEFWATWCPPCRRSIPHLNEIHARYKDKGLVIIGISDEKRDVVEKFRQKQPMNYAVAIDAKGALSRQLGIRGIPQAFVVGRDGIVLWEGHPMELTDAIIAKALK